MNRSIVGLLTAGAALCSAPAAHAQALTVYSSLPLHGPLRPTTMAIARGAALALREAGGTAGGRPVRYVSLDDSTRRAGAWAPIRVATNARRVAEDPAAIGYIGDFNSGASAISIPILNEVGVPEISPSNTAIGLTRGGPGTTPGEPLKYYPMNTRTYFRLTPNDTVQAGALVAAMKAARCSRVATLHDGEVYGDGIAALVRRGARPAGLKVVADRRVRPRSDFRAIARAVTRARAGCVVYGGVTANGAVGVFRALGRTVARARYFAADGVADGDFATGIGRAVARRTLIAYVALDPSAYPAAGQRVIGLYHDQYAAYGYEAMKLLLDAVNAVGPDHAAIVAWLHGVRNRPGAIGTFGFDARGDTTLRTYGLYRIRGGRIEWDRSITG